MILLTGGAGYIGSHTAVALVEAGYDIIILDNFSNSSQSAIQRIEKLTHQSIPFMLGDIRDSALLDKLFKTYPIESVVHFAGLKAVGESMLKPLEYFDNNIQGTLQLLTAMRKANIYKLVFSSSATVYGDNEHNEFIETMPMGVPTNHYGYTKLVVEQMLAKLAQAEPQWSFANLRYFNPIGAHPSGDIGEDPQGIPNNLLPYIAQVALGKLQQLNIYGQDYPTPDGTAVRDYIHVMDLAVGHLAALKFIQQQQGNHIWNLGTGKGLSVLDVVHAFEKVTGIHLNYRFSERRVGDIAACWANADKAKQQLDWQAQYNIEQMISDLWRWQSQNPNGYRV